MTALNISSRQALAIVTLCLVAVLVPVSIHAQLPAAATSVIRLEIPGHNIVATAVLVHREARERASCCTF
jgi:hypothetical protein